MATGTADIAGIDGIADILVIGGGMAGASAAFALAEHARVVLLERESQPGYHTTGRSAALFTETYGNATIRALTAAGRGFLEDPPEGFARPLLTPRGTLFLARADQEAALGRLLVETAATPSPPERIDEAAARALCPVLRPGYAAAAAYEAAAEDIDVAALLQGYLRGLRARGGRVVTGGEVTALARQGGAWVAETRAGRVCAPVVVNAAGAWADTVAARAGLAPLGLVPMRRTAFTFAAPEGMDPARWPATLDVDEAFYFRPDAGRILGSPADETPSEPCDAQPEELDLAIGVDRIETATTLSVRRLASRWAGLRNFAPDRTPVAGFEPGAEGFFWLAGQGGYGIQTAPALARLAAALVAGAEVPADLAARGVTRAALAPERLRAAPTGHAQGEHHG